MLTIISDKKLGVSSGGSLIDYYNPEIKSAQDYYPFGMTMPGRFPLGGAPYYKYTFNGKENDWEAKGWQNQQDYGMRVYDPRLGRFLSVDPLKKDYPWYTPYQFAGNKPIANIDLDGAEEKPAYKGSKKGEKASTFIDIETPTPGGQPGCADCFTKTERRTADWYWYDGSLNRKASADWYSKEEYDYITQDWENGQVLPKYDGGLLTEMYAESWEQRRVGNHIVRNWNGYWVWENGYLGFDEKGQVGAYPAIMELGGGGQLLKGLGAIGRLRKSASGLFKLGEYTVYAGFKDGVLYIGKTGYTIAQRYAGKVAPAGVRALEGLSGTIPNNGIAKGIEQIVMELNGWKGAGTTVLSNKNASTLNEVYKTVARRWLNANVTDWQTLYKFQ